MSIPTPKELDRFFEDDGLREAWCKLVAAIEERIYGRECMAKYPDRCWNDY